MTFTGLLPSTSDGYRPVPNRSGANASGVRERNEGAHKRFDQEGNAGKQSQTEFVIVASSSRPHSLESPVPFL